MISKEQLHPLIQAERLEALKEHPEKTFNSMHEAYAVLLEEVEEAIAESEKIRLDMAALWSSIKYDFSEDIQVKRIRAVQNTATFAIAEYLQVLGVCEKALGLPIDIQEVEDGKTSCD